MVQIVQLPLPSGPQAAGDRVFQAMSAIPDFMRAGTAQGLAMAQVKKMRDETDLASTAAAREQERYEAGEARIKKAEEATAKINDTLLRLSQMGSRPRERGGGRRMFAPGIGQLPTLSEQDAMLVKKWDAANDSMLREAVGHLSALPPDVAAAYGARIMSYATERKNTTELANAGDRLMDLRERGMLAGATIGVDGMLSTIPDPDLEGRAAALEERISSGAINPADAEAELASLVGEAARRRTNMANVAQLVQRYESMLPAMREQTKRPLRYAGELISALKMTLPGATDEEVRRQIEVFNSRIDQAMRGNRPVTNSRGETFFMDEAQADAFQQRQERMEQMELEVGLARLDLLREQVSGTDDELRKWLKSPSQYYSAAHEQVVAEMEQGADIQNVHAEAQKRAAELMTADVSAYRLATKKPEEGQTETAPSPAQGGAAKVYKDLPQPEQARIARQFNALIAAGKIEDAAVLMQQAGIAPGDRTADGILPIPGQSLLKSVEESVAEREAWSKKVLSNSSMYTSEEVQEAQQISKGVRNDRRDLDRLKAIVKQFKDAGLPDPTNSKDAWLLAYSKSKDAKNPNETIRGQYGPGVDVDAGAPERRSAYERRRSLEWIGQKNGWVYSPEEARAAAARLRGE